MGTATARKLVHLSLALAGDEAAHAHTKRCPRCTQNKPASAFSVDRSAKTGLKSECKACGNEALRALRASSPEARDRLRGYRRTSSKKHYAAHMVKNARNRARKLGIPFGITAADLVVPDYCPVLGVRLEISTNAPTANSPSVDRINPALGYVPGNVAVISLRANRIKDNASVAEHERVLAWMKMVGAP